METIKVQTKIAADRHKVWELWTGEEHVTQWNFASDEWCCPKAVNEVKPGGRFSWRMEAKDGSMGFDYAGTYDKVEEATFLSKRLEDGRKVEVSFELASAETVVTERFEPDENDLEPQKQGWQAILDNFKKYVEGA